MRTAAVSKFGLSLIGTLAAGCQASAEAPMQVGIYRLEAERLEGPTWVAARRANRDDDLEVLVTVDSGGRVIAAKVLDNEEKLDPAPGLAAVRQWRFRPQSFDGKPVIAIGTVRIEYRHPEDRPDPSAPFPQARPEDTEITLERGACFGSCPDYKVVVSGDGTVRFSTEENDFAGTATEVHRAYNGHSVLLPGTHLAHVDPGLVARLIDKFRAARFFGLKSSYEAQITDNSTQALTYRAGKSSKRVVDYVGSMVGMPAAVEELEQEVDAVAGTGRWVYGNADTIAWLASTGFDFRSAEAAGLAAAAATPLQMYDETARHTEAMISMLIDKGVPLDAQVETGAGQKGKLGPFLASSAAMAGTAPLVERLAGMGYLNQVPPKQLNRAFASGMGCSPAVARALVKAGANPTPETGEGTALLAIRGLFAMPGWRRGAAGGDGAYVDRSRRAAGSA